MSHILSRDRAALPSIGRRLPFLSNAVAAPRRYRMAWLASCAVAAAMGLSPISPASAGCNSGNLADTDLLTGLGCQGNASGAGATAVGDGADAEGQNATALGFLAGPGDVAGATNIGAFSGYIGGVGSYSTAVGAGQNASTASRADGSRSVAIGGGNGAVLNAPGKPAIALNGALASGFISTAVGTASKATNDFSSAFGLGSKATAADSAAYGDFSTASGPGSVALGSGALANKPGSVAIGQNSIANVANTVSVGSSALRRRIINVAAAVNPTDAVNLGQIQAMLAAKRSAAVASAGGADNAKQLIDEIRQELANLQTLVKQQQEEIAELKGRNATPTHAASGL